MDVAAVAIREVYGSTVVQDPACSQNEKGEVTGKADGCMVGSDLHAVDIRRAGPQERHGEWVVEWKNNPVISFRDTPETGINEPLESHPFCRYITEPGCEVTREVSQKKVLASTRAFIRTYSGHRSRFAHRTLLGNCKGAARVCDTCIKKEVVGRGDHPQA